MCDIYIYVYSKIYISTYNIVLTALKLHETNIK